MSLRRAGFTLLEVLIALVVVAVALAALARGGSQVLDAQAELEARTLALWVADNQLATLRLEAGAGTGRRQGVARMAGREWRWEMLIQQAPGGELKRVDVAVYHGRGEHNRPVLIHTGFHEP